MKNKQRFIVEHLMKVWDGSNWITWAITDQWIGESAHYGDWNPSEYVHLYNEQPDRFNKLNRVDRSEFIRI